ncbi:hypothetical protein [Ralstonia syzygii]|uniref:Putative Hemagglutinin-like protein n=1 Tax=Ralstonia syzygii R24 TaxID=907261 RepID=G3A1J7_9RALS|nr:putative Hemagglutinin-like protein [Ralstonia syzygii R24]
MYSTRFRPIVWLWFTVIANNPAAEQTRLEGVTATITDKAPSFWAPSNDPVAVGVGGYAGTLNWKDIKEMYGTSYSVHSCGGAAAVGCAPSNVNTNTLFSYTGLSIDTMNQNRQATTLENLNNWLANPQPVNVPSMNLNTLQNNQNERNWQQQLQQVPSVSLPQVNSITPVSNVDTRLNQLNQLRQQLGVTGGQ